MVILSMSGIRKSIADGGAYCVTNTSDQVSNGHRTSVFVKALGGKEYRLQIEQNGPMDDSTVTTKTMTGHVDDVIEAAERIAFGSNRLGGPMWYDS